MPFQSIQYLVWLVASSCIVTKRIVSKSIDDFILRPIQLCKSSDLDALRNTCGHNGPGDTDLQAICDFAGMCPVIESQGKRLATCNAFRKETVGRSLWRPVRVSRFETCCALALLSRATAERRQSDLWLRLRASVIANGQRKTNFKNSGSTVAKAMAALQDGKYEFLASEFDQQAVLDSLDKIFTKDTDQDLCAAVHEYRHLLDYLVLQDRVMHLKEFLFNVDLACKATGTDKSAGIKSLLSQSSSALSHIAVIQGQIFKESEIYNAQFQHRWHWREIQKNLKTGDLVFSTGYTWISKAIKATFGGEVSHIAMVVKPLDTFIGAAQSEAIRQRFRDAGDASGERARHFLREVPFVFEADYGYERRLTPDPVRDVWMCNEYSPDKVRDSSWSFEASHGCKTWLSPTTNGLGLAPLWNKLLDEEESGLGTPFLSIRFLNKALREDQINGLQRFYEESRCKEFDTDPGVILKHILHAGFSGTSFHWRRDPDAQYYCSAAVARALQFAGVIPKDENQAEVKKYTPQFFYGEELNHAIFRGDLTLRAAEHHRRRQTEWRYEDPVYVALSEGMIPLQLPLRVPLRRSNGSWACDQRGFPPDYDEDVEKH